MAKKVVKEKGNRRQTKIFTNEVNKKRKTTVVKKLKVAVPAAKDRGIALILEILPGLFGFLGFGWIYSGNTNTGIYWLLGVLVWDFIAVIIIAVTVGFGAICTIPMNLILIAMSASSLNTYTKEHPELFGE